MSKVKIYVNYEPTEIEVQHLEVDRDYEADMFRQPRIRLRSPDQEYWAGLSIGNYEERLLEIIKQLDTRITELEKQANNRIADMGEETE